MINNNEHNLFMLRKSQHVGDKVDSESAIIVSEKLAKGNYILMDYKAGGLGTLPQNK